MRVDRDVGSDNVGEDECSQAEDSDWPPKAIFGVSNTAKAKPPRSLRRRPRKTWPTEVRRLSRSHKNEQAGAYKGKGRVG